MPKKNSFSIPPGATNTNDRFDLLQDLWVDPEATTNRHIAPERSGPPGSAAAATRWDVLDDGPATDVNSPDIADGSRIRRNDDDIDPKDFPSQPGKVLFQESKVFGNVLVKNTIQSRGEMNLGDEGGTFRNDRQLLSSDSGPHHDYKTWGFYDKIVGGDGDDIIYGGGRLHLNTGSTYDHDDLIFGGGGNDIIYGLEGNDTLSGGAGDDKLYGGAGNDILYGGSGNDVLDGGSGTDVLYGGSGNDWLFSGRVDGNTGQTRMTGGSGSDVFVIGDRSAIGHSETAFDFDSMHDVLFTVAGMVPKFGGIITGIRKLVDMLPKSATGDASSIWDGTNAVIVEDFNPIEDVIIIPLNRDGSPNVTLKFDGLPAGEAFRIYDDSGSGTKLIAIVRWDDLSKALGLDFSQMSVAEMDAFKAAIDAGKMIMDSSGITTFNGENIDLPAEELAGLGTGRFLMIGSHSGTIFRGSNQADYGFGTNHNDVLMGYNYGNGGDALTAGDDVLRGFGGDDLFITGSGVNKVYGGAGSDTVAYYDADSGITADLSRTFTDHLGRKHATVQASYSNKFGDTRTGTDYLYDVENVIGTAFDDVFIGNGKNNTFISGGGNDVMTGGGGADTFILNGGTNTVLDFNSAQGDRVILDKEAYGINSRYDFWDVSGGSGVINLVKDSGNGEIMVKLHIHGTGGFMATGLRDANGNVEWWLNDGNNTFVMRESDGVVHALRGNDHVTGSNSDDVIYGGDGNDTLIGRDGDDRLYGGNGNDRLEGGRGDDKLYGGAGHDWIEGGSGDDIIFGGSGDDHLFGGAGDDVIYSGGASQTLDPWGRDRLYGEDGDDVLIHDGKLLADLFGGNGSDLLVGLDGTSQMYGGKGNDYFFADGGHTIATGGADLDVFVMRGGTMEIRDYAAGEDVIFDYKAYGYSSYANLQNAWAFSKSGNTATLTDKSTGKVMLRIEGDVDAFREGNYDAYYGPTPDEWL